MRLKLALLGAVVAAAMAFVASAQAYEGGWTLYHTGYPTPNSHVYIHNDTTGTGGSTFSDASGYYQFNGLSYSYRYTIYACSSDFNWVSPSQSFTYWGSNIRIDLTESNPTANCF